MVVSLFAFHLLTCVITAQPALALVPLVIAKADGDGDPFSSGSINVMARVGKRTVLRGQAIGVGISVQNDGSGPIDVPKGLALHSNVRIVVRERYGRRVAYKDHSLAV